MLRRKERERERKKNYRRFIKRISRFRCMCCSICAGAQEKSVWFLQRKKGHSIFFLPSFLPASQVSPSPHPLISPLLFLHLSTLLMHSQKWRERKELEPQLLYRTVHHTTSPLHIIPPRRLSPPFFPFNYPTSYNVLRRPFSPPSVSTPGRHSCSPPPPFRAPGEKEKEEKEEEELRFVLLQSACAATTSFSPPSCTFFWGGRKAVASRVLEMMYSTCCCYHYCNGANINE